MIARIHESMRKEDKGFTLVELLVVIVIIGILIAIAIPAFLRFRERGWESQAESDLKTSVTAAEAYNIGNGGSYAGLDEAALKANGLNQPAGSTVVVDVTAQSVNGYSITSCNTRGGTGFRVTLDPATGESTGVVRDAAVTC